MSTHRKLGKPTDQRMAMLRAMTTALLEEGQITTTYARAKEVAPMAEKMMALFSAFWTYIHSIVWFMSKNFTFFGHKVRFSDLICPKIVDIAFGIWLFWTYGRILLKICPKGSCERPL